MGVDCSVEPHSTGETSSKRFGNHCAAIYRVDIRLTRLKRTRVTGRDFHLHGRGVGQPASFFSPGFGGPVSSDPEKGSPINIQHCGPTDIRGERRVALAMPVDCAADGSINSAYIGLSEAWDNRYVSHV
jgi:hypothetical protein